MTGRTVVLDVEGNPVTLRDVGPIDPAREHDTATCDRVGCWACAPMPWEVAS